MNSLDIPEIKVVQKGNRMPALRKGQIMCIQVFDADYFERLRRSPKLNFSSITIKRQMSNEGPLQMVGRFINPVKLVAEEHIRHGHTEIGGVPVELFPQAFQILYLRESDIGKIGQIIERLTGPRKSLLERFSESTEEAARILGGK